jgi:hypothetical protein
VLEHPADRAVRGVRRLSGPPNVAPLGRRERTEAIDGGRTRLGQRAAQVEVPAVCRVGGLTHGLQRTDERVHISLVGVQDVQEDVAKGSALRRLCAHALLVDPIHEGKEISA